MHEDSLDRRSFLKTTGVTSVSALLGGMALDVAKAAVTYGKMPVRTLGHTGLKVSIMGLGGYHAAVPDKEEDTITIIHRALDLGITFFDNADCYMKGAAEERMGKALEGRRQRIVLMTKVDQRDAKGSLATLEQSLKRLRTDYLDVWQFHGVQTVADLEKILGPGGAMETAEKAKKEGKIRFIGMTGHFDPQVHFEALKRYPLDTIMMPINVVDPHFKSFRKIALDEAVRRGVGILAFKTLAFGRIVSMKVASPAESLRWVWSQPVGVLISGCDSIHALNYNVYLAKTFKPMPDAEQAALMARTESHAGTAVEDYKRA
jgi:aryl-alcohol dehydrogenase-like predicted oxidoreductase